MKKIIRSLCYFSDRIDSAIEKRLNEVGNVLENNDYIIQTKRVCVNEKLIAKLDDSFSRDLFLSVGSLDSEEAYNQLDDFFKANNVSFHLDLTNEIKDKDIELLFEIIKVNPKKTFNFTYVFNNVDSSPYFPSANYAKEGLAIGLQSTDLSNGSETLKDWLMAKRKVWNEVVEILKNEKDFLGIDSSVAPLFEGDSSLVNLVNKFAGDFKSAITTDFFLQITNFIKKENPKPTGLCGLMFPCLEDFELAREYKKGDFSIERNVFLSLHSGLGIDTYPIGIDEKPDRVREILQLVRGLSNKYRKPLSVRFVSDGKAKIGEKTDFQNQYLKDVLIRKI